MATTRGLILTPGLRSSQVASLEMTFEPSIGIMARKIDKLGLDIRSFREPLRRSIRDVVIPSIAMNFAKHGRPRWPNLSQDTEQQRLYDGSGWAILDRTGKLKKTMTQIGIWHIDREKALLAKLPDAVYYGGIHQAGMKGYEGFHDPVAGTHVNVGQAGAIPARPFVMLQPEDNEAITMIFDAWLEERIVMAGLGRTQRLRGI